MSDHNKSPLNHVNPFIGTEPVDLPEPEGLAASWVWLKPQVGNVHPGAAIPFGMVTANAYSGAYPTGYGRWDIGYEGYPSAMFDEKIFTGFTHIHPSGVGAIRKYYNYARITPMLEELGGINSLGEAFVLKNESAKPGYYACDVGDTGIHAEVTVSDRCAHHRYTFPESKSASIFVDFSHGGIQITEGESIPLKAHVALRSDDTSTASVTLEGLELAMAVKVSGWTDTDMQLWSDEDCLDEQKDLTFEYIRPTSYEPFGVVFSGPTYAGQVIELEIAFSWRGTQNASAHLTYESFKHTLKEATRKWEDNLETIEVKGGTQSERDIFYTSLYRCQIKPCEARNESPFWPWDGPFFFDMSTMWDMYKTQLPLMLSLFPKRGADFINSLLNIVEMEGNFPIGYRMARGNDFFNNQASALAHITLLDAFYRSLPGIDWERAVTMMAKDLKRDRRGESFFRSGKVHPLTHTLDYAYGCYCTAILAEHIGDSELSEQMQESSLYWRNAFDSNTGLLADSTYYEGTKWNYSFRFLHDMQGRIEAAGGKEKFVALLDQFFGYDQPAYQQLGERPSKSELADAYEMHRFQGLNNEPDMEAPYIYCYAQRHDRTCEVLRAGMKYMYANTPGGLAGNDDSGGMTSWYVWSAMGIFPVAGQNEFIIGSPIFDEVTLHLPNGPFTLIAHNNSDTNIYIDKATLDGRLLDRPFLTWEDLSNHRLELFMTDQPCAW